MLLNEAVLRKWSWCAHISQLIKHMHWLDKEYQFWGSWMLIGSTVSTCSSHLHLRMTHYGSSTQAWRELKPNTWTCPRICVSGASSFLVDTAEFHCFRTSIEKPLQHLEYLQTYRKWINVLVPNELWWRSVAVVLREGFVRYGSVRSVKAIFQIFLF